jgi:hypothetical protein
MSLVNQLLTPKLAKLTIEAYSDASFKNAIKKTGVTSKGRLSLPYNPESLSVSYGSLYRVKDTIALKGKKTEEDNLKYEGYQPYTLSLSLQLDATLPENEALDVAEMVKVLETFGYATNPETGVPPYLKVSWGDTEWSGGREELHCRMATMGVSYTLFDTNGKPLRAKVSLSFVEQRPVGDFKENAAALNLPTVNVSIPDLPVLATLMALLVTTAAVANETIDYVNAGFENDLDNLHALVPGGTLIFGAEKTNPGW